MENRQQACFVPRPLRKLEPEHLQRNKRRAVASIKMSTGRERNGKTNLKLEM